MAIQSQANRTILSGQSINMSATLVYDENGNSAAGDGWQNSRYNNIIVQIGVATLTATSVTYRIEGRSASGRAGEILTASLNTVSSIDTFIEVSELIEEIRVGHSIADNTATPNNVYTKLILTETI